MLLACGLQVGFPVDVLASKVPKTDRAREKLSTATSKKFELSSPKHWDAFGDPQEGTSSRNPQNRPV